MLVKGCQMLVFLWVLLGSLVCDFPSNIFCKAVFVATHSEVFSIWIYLYCVCIYIFFWPGTLFCSAKWAWLGGLAPWPCLLALPSPSWQRHVHCLWESCTLSQLQGHSVSMLALSKLSNSAHKPHLSTLPPERVLLFAQLVKMRKLTFLKEVEHF